MPDRAPSFCVVPGCARFAEGRRRCRPHAVIVERARPNRDTRRWYYLAAWKAIRLEVLRDQAYACAACGQATETLEVDHIEKHDGDPIRFWDRANLQALCRTCHQRKTQRGD